MARAGKSLWTDERVAELKRLRKEGLSAQEISDLWGGEPTRNAVVGKTFRLGMSTERKVKHQGQKAQHRKAIAPKPKPKPVVPSIAPPPVEDMSGYGLTVMSVRDEHCRAMDGEGFFCGNPKDGKNKQGVASSYCAFHRAEYTVTPKSQEGRGKWKRT